jgi:hypothetical protein
LHKLIELLFRRLEGGRQYSGLVKAFRLALLHERTSPDPALAQTRREANRLLKRPLSFFAAALDAAAGRS